MHQRGDDQGLKLARITSRLIGRQHRFFAATIITTLANARMNHRSRSPSKIPRSQLLPARHYSKEFRDDVLSACDSGKGTREVALLFDVSESWLRRVRQERREFGKTAPLLKRNQSSQWAKYSDQIMAICAARPDTTLAELKEELGTTFSRSTLCIALRKLKLTCKKKSSLQQNKSVKT